MSGCSSLSPVTKGISKPGSEEWNVPHVNKSSFLWYQAKERIRIWPQNIWTKLHGALLFGVNSTRQCKHLFYY